VWLDYDEASEKDFSHSFVYAYNGDVIVSSQSSFENPEFQQHGGSSLIAWPFMPINALVMPA